MSRDSLIIGMSAIRSIHWYTLSDAIEWQDPAGNDHDKDELEISQCVVLCALTMANGHMIVGTASPEIEFGDGEDTHKKVEDCALANALNRLNVALAKHDIAWTAQRLMDDYITRTQPKEKLTEEVALAVQADLMRSFTSKGSTQADYLPHGLDLPAGQSNVVSLADRRRKAQSGIVVTVASVPKDQELAAGYIDPSIGRKVWMRVPASLLAKTGQEAMERGAIVSLDEPPEPQPFTTMDATVIFVHDALPDERDTMHPHACYIENMVNSPMVSMVNLLVVDHLGNSHFFEQVILINPADEQLLMDHGKATGFDFIHATWMPYQAAAKTR